MQFGDIWHVQNSFSPVGKPDPNNYECDLSLGKCEIGPVPVGGFSTDLTGMHQTPSETGGSSTTGSSGAAGRLMGTLAAVVAAAVALAAAAWYARRRRAG